MKTIRPHPRATTLHAGVPARTRRPPGGRCIAHPALAEELVPWLRGRALY